jgi:hypothetical protein
LSDTVGFIRDLPHGLVDAFEATLQEAVDADLLLHVVDAANPNFPEQMLEVQRVLQRNRCADIPQVLVFNKLDALENAKQPLPCRIAWSWMAAVPRLFVSARTGEGLRLLRERTVRELAGRRRRPCHTPAGRCPIATRRRLIGHNHGLRQEKRPQRMNLHTKPCVLGGVKGRVRGMFNLNDPRWGRGDDKPADEPPRGPARPTSAVPPPAAATAQRGQGPNQGPPDLDELWRDFNRKLGGLFGGGAAAAGPATVVAAAAAVASSPT